MKSCAEEVVDIFFFLSKICFYLCVCMCVCIWTYALCVFRQRQEDFHKFKGSKVHIVISRPVKVLETLPQQKTKKKKKKGIDVGWTDLWKTDMLTELRIFMATFMLYW